MSTGPILQPLTVQPTGRQPAPRHPGTWSSPSAAWLNRHRQAASRTIGVGVGVGRRWRGMGGGERRGRGKTQNKSQTLECVRILMFSPTRHPKSKRRTYEIQQQKFTLQTSHEMIQVKDGQTANEKKCFTQPLFKLLWREELSLRCTCVLRAVKKQEPSWKGKNQKPK